MNDTDAIVLSAGTVFVVSDRHGDIVPQTAEGLYAHDTRFLSSMKLTVDGGAPTILSADTFEHAIASFYAHCVGIRGIPSGSVSLVRDRYVSHGLHEDVTLLNHSAEPLSLHLNLTFDADFADIFEIRLHPPHTKRHIGVEPRNGHELGLVYYRGAFRRETWISFSGDPTLQGKTAIFEITLPPKGSWKTCVSVLPTMGGTPPEPMECVQELLGPPFGPYLRHRVTTFNGAHAIGFVSPSEAQDSAISAPRLETDHWGLHRAYQSAVTDLRALRMVQEDGHYVLAAGLPWFMALFGRDSIISALQTKLLGPDLMVGTLHTLSRLQAKEADEFREAQPGKIPHEVREGELASFEQVPHTRYFGTVDATPLFLILLWEAYQWTGNVELLRRFLPAAEEALQWINVYGDADRDGFVEYHGRTAKGLRNQCWKDSEDSISFADGTLATGPIAVAEVQGYVYEAKRRLAAIFRILGQGQKAARLQWEAERLKFLFNQAFWMPEENYYAVALDGEKRQVNSVTSNPGHCLWSGIVDDDKAAAVVERLTSPDMFSGWGIRTLSTEMARYDPVSYHNGSVWPHDNSIIAAGMTRYGFTRQAREVIFALLDAAASFPQHRLPELFCGYPRREHSSPVPYPLANSPQAWSSGAVVFFLEVLLGVTPMGDRLLVEAPSDGLRLSLNGVRYRGSQRVL